MAVHPRKMIVLLVHGHEPGQEMEIGGSYFAKSTCQFDCSSQLEAMAPAASASTACGLSSAGTLWSSTLEWRSPFRRSSMRAARLQLRYRVIEMLAPLSWLSARITTDWRLPCVASEMVALNPAALATT